MLPQLSLEQLADRWQAICNLGAVGNAASDALALFDQVGVNKDGSPAYRLSGMKVPARALDELLVAVAEMRKVREQKGQ